MNRDFDNYSKNDNKDFISGNSDTNLPPFQDLPSRAPDESLHDPHTVKDLSRLFSDETSFTKLFDFIPIGIGMAALGGTVIYANAALQKMMGYSLDELKKINLADLYVDPDGREKMLTVMNRDGRLENFEIKMKRGDGSVFVSLVNINIVERNGEKIIFNTARDVTEQRRAAEELRNSEDRFRLVVENMPAGVAICEKDSISVNSYIEELTGYSREELKNPITFFNKLFRHNAAKIERIFSSKTGGDVPACFSVEFYSKDGGIRIVDISRMHVDANMDVWIFHDVTDYLFVQQKLMKSEAHMAEVQQMAHLGSYECELGSGKITWSDHCYHIMGLKKQKVTFKLIKSLIHPEDIDRYYSHYFDLFSNNADFDIEYRVIKPDGCIIHIKDRACIKYNDNQKPMFCTGYYKDITESKRLEKTLIESEERYRMLFETSRLGVVYQDADGHIVSSNPAAESILGLTHEQITGRTSVNPEWKSIKEDGSEFPGETHPAMLALKYGKIVRDVVMGVFNPLKERYVWINISAVPLFRQGETKPWQVYVIFEDITEKKEKEEVRKLLEINIIKSEERYRMIFETARLGIVYHDADGKIILANPAAERILGFSADFLEGKSCNNPQWNTIREDGTEILTDERPVVRVLKEGKAVSGIIVGVFNPVKERRVWINLSASPLFGPGETKPSGVYVIFEDVTEKKDKNDELKRSEQQKIQLIEAAHEGYCAVNADRKITFVNRRMCEMTGYSKEELIGMDLIDFVEEKNKKMILTAFEKCLRGEKISFSSETVHKDGHKIFVTLSASSIINENGVCNGVFALINDQTKEKVLENEIRSVRYELAASCSFNSIVGKSEMIAAVFETLPSIAEIDCNVLLEGASGTGKNLFAKVIHDISNRKERPFVVVNCGTLPENLLESELFGYVKGAFTGADRDKPGKFAAAEGGIIFLDEIGELPLNLQVKLLRVIEEKQYEPIGSNKTIRSDVRIIAATNRDLKAMAEDGKFRADLYFRLKIVSVKIPSLKERPGDINLLTEYFIGSFNEKYNKNIDCISAEVSRFFKLYDFPGNVRELKNMIEHAFIFCNGEILQMQHLPSEYRPVAEKLFNQKENVETVLHNSKTVILEKGKNKPPESDTTEKELLIRTLEKCDGNKTHAAKKLGIDRTTLWRKLKKHGIV